MKKIILLFAAICTFLLTGCCATIDANKKIEETQNVFSVEWNETVGTKLADLKYADGDYNTFDLYLPADKTSEKAAHLILFTHGGGWTSGSKEDGEIYCKYFTSKGYVCASLNYTLFDKTHNTSIVQIRDEMVKAVERAKTVCEENGYALTDMANFGFSAGACQSLYFAFAQKEAAELPVRFIVDMSGPTTFNPDCWTKEAGAYWYVVKTLGLDGSAESKAAFVSKYSNQTVTAEMINDGTAQSIWESISPVNFIDENTVPVLMAFGTVDGVVPTVHSRLLRETLEKYNVPFECIEFPNSGHALSCDKDKMEEFKKKAEEYCEKYF